MAIVEKDAEPPQRLAENGFDLVLGDSETRNLIRLCRERQLQRHRLDELRKVQHQHAIFYSTVLQISELRQRHQLKGGSVREVVAGLMSREAKDQKSLQGPGSPIVAEEDVHRIGGRRPRRRGFDSESLRVSVRQTTVAALPEANERSIALRLRPLWSEALSDDFVLDMGVPYQRNFRPRYMHEAGAFPVVDSDLQQLLSEMHACLTVVFRL